MNASVSTCPDFWSPENVRSVRYWGHSGKTKPYLNDGAMAHCIGSTIGASPMFAVPERLVRTRKDEMSLLKYSNWSRSENGLRVFRLTPKRGLLFFGKEIEPIAEMIENSTLSQTRLYELIGNMVVPRVGRFCGEVLKQQLEIISPTCRSKGKSRKLH